MRSGSFCDSPHRGLVFTGVSEECGWVGLLHLWSSRAQDVCTQSVMGRLRGSVGDQNAEGNVEGRSLDNEVSEGIKG